jgi:tRNA nucleotidyltransferase (CCA-adding enzyme)
LKEHIKVYEKVIEISEAIKKTGGRSLLVGGSVRDPFFGKISKDFDLEVYGLEAQKLEKVVKQFGKVSDVGKAFGILKISFGGGIDIDISLPRTDSKIGEGHRGFEIKTIPNMNIEDAAKRRDFTINSMAADPLTGELYDPFNGLKDIKKRCLKITDSERFCDDSLRVMRALQFVGRFGLEIDQESGKIIQEIIPDLKELPKERICEEWKKLLLKSEKPSLGLASGMALGVFKEIHPEFPPLAETPQEEKWHPEGDAWIHTLMSVDEAAKIIRREELEEDKSLAIMFSALCHDLGKITTTEFKNGQYISHGHEKAGEEPTKKFLAKIGIDNLTRDKIIKLVINHLVPTMFYIEEVLKKKKISNGAIRKLAKRIDPATIYELTLVAEADHLGRGPFDKPEIREQLLLSPEKFLPKEWLLKRARAIEVEKSKPADLIRGRDLLNLEYKPGIDFGKIIKLANNLRDEKEFTREMIFQILEKTKNTKEAVRNLEALF